MGEPSDQLERHSLFLLAATLVGHAGNYAYHFITGRLLPESEYGLLMALFGAANILLLPMSALNISLSRAVATLHSQARPGAVTALLRIWSLRLGLAAAGFPIGILLLSPLLKPLLELERLAPLLLAAFIPGFNLLLTLTGAGLQGLQRFQGLALRGSVLFVLRALLVGVCLTWGFRSAGWALTAHLVGMTAALAVGTRFLIRGLPPHDPGAVTPPVLPGSLAAFPVLLAFSALMTADVVLIRALHPEIISGQFARAATLGRIILWLPLPIAQVMFPKVVRADHPTATQRRTLFKALAYTAALVLCALAGLWIAGPPIFRMLFGQTPTPEQIKWLHGIGLSMACLGPVYVVLQFELARGRVARLFPLCALASVYLLGAWIRDVSPDELIQFLLVASALSLVTSVRALIRPH